MLSVYPVICNEAAVSCIVKWNVLINGWKPQTIYTSNLDIWNYTVLNKDQHMHMVEIKYLIFFCAGTNGFHQDHLRVYSIC